jgi:hypothetical protein
MKFATLETIFRALEAAGVRYLVAGGVAVNAHGYQRLTHDLDLVLQLKRENVLAALRALAGLGYRPLLPVPMEAFADAEQRRRWIEDRNLQVFSLVSETYPDATVDIFAAEPFAFESEHVAALTAELGPGLRVRFVALPTLIAMKEAAGRARDRDDAEHLRQILEELKSDEPETR